MKQEVTRMHRGWSLDSTILNNEWTTLHKEDIKLPPHEGKVKQRYFMKLM